ncbi:endonuclease domain-containing protein [Caulobacter sp. KR2-114]|uniref:endonuclease domain-containing protein n=1 Tax=Caulobacter sp. KR2-114 TaxID=3400912 RepID=UPI003C04E9F6
MPRANLKPRTRRARALRRSATDAERKVWSALCNRQLEGFKFRRQVPVGRYVADFACREARLIVELDGSHHEAQAVYDAARTRDLEAAGWQVLRFDNAGALLETDGLVLAILEVLRIARP